jgi:DNA-binding MarR family transcriptional regulator
LAARALFSLGRTFARQSVRELVAERSGRAIDLSRVLVAQAVYDEQGDAAGADRAGAGAEALAEVTVGTVAERLGIDPSTASRLVADVIRDGYLVRSASAHDARRVRLDLTEAGRTLVEASRRFQRQVFLEAMAGWSETERAEFARLFLRFAEAAAGRYAEIAGRG